jgi:hypothetical protein
MATITENLLVEFKGLPPEAQQTLLAALSQVAGRPTKEDEEYFAKAAAEMAADPEIQREIAAINEEFRCTDFDGLGQL